MWSSYWLTFLKLAHSFLARVLELLEITWLKFLWFFCKWFLCFQTRWRTSTTSGGILTVSIENPGAIITPMWVLKIVLKHSQCNWNCCSWAISLQIVFPQGNHSLLWRLLSVPFLFLSCVWVISQLAFTRQLPVRGLEWCMELKSGELVDFSPCLPLPFQAVCGYFAPLTEWKWMCI